ncbi:4Fe-4S binding protein [Pseudophaeobacter profundi]|uniref:4Fe-4S binding protein n=1 Tax=Pseudophaeobacter profundi TaxID=3034152 RepID=UPI00242ED850|nr:4Fe-4S binding protein [Pseudophaeobacter profundi]
MAKQLILCDCSGTQAFDPEALSTATGLGCSQVYTSLCSTQIDAAAAAISSGESVICCAQEKRFFADLAADLEAPAPACLDLRDRAGWTADSGDLLPKMSALVAEAALDLPPGKSLDVTSEGLCLILGAPEIALAAAERLQDLLGVTVLIETSGEDLDTTGLGRGFDLIRGQLRQAKGALGQFQLRFDALQQRDVTGRQWGWSAPRDGAVSDCDILLDLRGGTPLFPAPEKREGYLRADPANPLAVADAILAASQLVGTFEKPLYLRHEPLLCAHSRASQTGCNKCLDHCPTSAISSAGDHVTIDPMVCAGCGACSSLCPSGAITYDAPPTEAQFRRIQTLAKAYQDAGGTAPRLLVVNEHGGEMIQLAARFGRGLPADVVPLEVTALNAFGHAEILAALAAGFADVSILLAPGADPKVQASELALAQAISGSNSARLLDIQDPDALSDALYDSQPAKPIATPIRPMGSRRQITRQAALALHATAGQDAAAAPLLPLPDQAPYGAVLVDQDSCTLCLSCVSLCPSGALGDNPDLPQLRFQEEACLQCGICANTCPEDAITLQPRLNLDPAALSQVVLHEEDPFACVECGALFGVKSTIEKITEKLAGKHAMFARPEMARMIQMCDDCRVQAQFHQKDSPLAGAERPRVRTTEDYLSKRRDH